MTDFTITEDFPRSEIEFDARFSNPGACYQYLFQLKWPDGFVCKRCGGQQYWLSSRNLYICTQCEHQHSLTAGTIMDSSKKPVTYWFKAMWWFTTRKSGISATNLKELLGFGSYGTAWTWLQKLGVALYVMSVKSCPAASRSMSSSSVVNVLASEVEGPKVKPS